MHVTLIFVLFLLPSMTSHTPASHLKYTHLCPSHNPLQCSCLENPMGGGAWWATVHGATKSQRRLSDFTSTLLINGLPRWLSGKGSAHQAGDVGLIPGSGRSPGEGDGNLLHCPCLGSPMDRGAWKGIVHGVAKSDTAEWLSARKLHLFLVPNS